MFSSKNFEKLERDSVESELFGSHCYPSNCKIVDTKQNSFINMVNVLEPFHCIKVRAHD